MPIPLLIFASVLLLVAWSLGNALLRPAQLVAVRHERAVHFGPVHQVGGGALWAAILALGCTGAWAFADLRLLWAGLALGLAVAAGLAGASWVVLSFRHAKHQLNVAPLTQDLQRRLRHRLRAGIAFKLVFLALWVYSWRALFRR